LSASSASKNARAWQSSSKTRVPGDLDLAHRQLPPEPGVPVGRGQRQRQPGHPAFEPHRHGAGGEAVADGLQPGRVAGGGESVGQFGEADPGLVCLPFGSFVTVEPDLDRVGEVGADLDEPGADPGVPDVDVEHRHPPLLLGEGELGARAGIGVAFRRGPHLGVLLCTADRHHRGTPGGAGGVQVGRHDVGFPVSGLELDHWNVVGVHPLAHRAPESGADLFEHRRRRDRVAAVVVQEVHHPARGLQLRHISGQIDPVQTGDIQAHVAGHHVRCRHYRHRPRSPPGPGLPYRPPQRPCLRSRGSTVRTGTTSPVTRLGGPRRSLSGRLGD
jgi:hypothetical protein